MEYSLAINKLFDTYGVDVMSTPFLALSILSDYVANDLYSKRLINILFRVHPSIDIITLFNTRNLHDAREQMGVSYPLFKDIATKREYVDMINPIAKYINPKEFTTSLKPKASTSNAGFGVAVVTKTPRPKSKPKEIKQSLVVKPKAQPKSVRVRMPRTTTKNLQAMIIDFHCKSFTIVQSNIPDVEVYVDGNLTKQRAKPILLQGVAMISYKYPGKEVLVRVPKRSYTCLTLAGLADTCFVGSDKGEPFDVTNLTIDPTFKEVFINAKGEKLNIDARNTTLSINGQFETIEAKVGKGRVSGKLDLLGLKNFTCNITQLLGDIKLKFDHAKFPPIYKGKTLWHTTFNSYLTLGQTKCEFNLDTRMGEIVIK